MPDSPLRECWDKLSRAEEHAQTLDVQIRQFLADDSHRIDRELDSKQSKYLFRLKVLQPIPQARWALIIGDCVHNARSALDYLAWRLAGSDLTDTRTLFPICLTSHDWDSNRWRRKRMHPDAIAELRKLQPYARSNPTTPSSLWTLQDLDARDKHKLLTLTRTVTKHLEINIAHPIDSRPWPIRFHDGPLENGTIVAEIDIPLGEHPEVDVASNHSFDIAFQQGIVGAGEEFVVREALWNILDTVKKVLSLFDALIVQNPNWIP